MKSFIIKQWSRKIAICLMFWAVGTVIWFYATARDFSQWANFTEWLGGILFVANVGEKFAPQNKGELFNGENK